MPSEIVPISQDIPPAMGEYHPELLSRRGEYTSWILTFVALASCAAFIFTGNSLPLMLIIMTLFLVISALAISLVNWVDRHTILRLNLQGIHYENGLRKLTLVWDEINQVQVIDSPFGRKIRVLSGKGYFEFRTFSEVFVRGRVKGRLGFAAGESILQMILNNASLNRIERSNGSVDYSRE